MVKARRNILKELSLFFVQSSAVSDKL